MPWKSWIKGICFMKTKIIYISGAEIFNIKDVHDAFDTVRRELGLNQDTILFGVPVDAEDALAGTNNVGAAEVVHEEQPVINVEQDIVEPIVEQESIVQDIVDEPIMENIVPEKKQKKTKKKIEPENDFIPTEVKSGEETSQKEEIIPILSVLGGEVQTVSEPELVDEAPDDDKYLTDDNFEDEPVKKTEETVLDSVDDLADTPVDTEVFNDIDIQVDIPTVEPEPTTVVNNEDDDDIQLEKLLQSVQSLHEDKEEFEVAEPELKVIDTVPDETDATLEKLANEFAENQDKIVNTTKSTTRTGRIGKLKNILPFKKAKHNDSSLMGDLFGWAGVAANDEEFGIPEFFPTAVKK